MLNLQPKEFFYWFNEICKIPHESRKEEKLVKYICDFATERKIDYSVDEIGNVFMTLPASKGYENTPAILLQSHLDMVCVNDDGVEFDFDTQPIKVKIEGDLLVAEATSLGADNAVGIATMLAVADDITLKHPKIELLFTTQEEIGLIGVRQFDMSKITARRMINMDSGDSHVLCIGSCGGNSAIIDHQFETYPVDANSTTLTISIEGLSGGHTNYLSKGHACAGAILTDLLTSINNLPIGFSEINVSKAIILTDAKITLTVSKDKKEQLINVITSTFNELKQKHLATDKNMCLSVSESSCDKVISTKASKLIIELLNIIKSKVIEKDEDNVILFEIIKKLSLDNGKLYSAFAIRSFYNDKFENEYNVQAQKINQLGFNLTLETSSPAWTPKHDSEFKGLAVSLHQQKFGYAPTIETILGGLDTSIIVSKIPDMQAIGFAPTARGAHTTSERLYIKEVPDFWTWMLLIIQSK